MMRSRYDGIPFLAVAPKIPSQGALLNAFIMSSVSTMQCMLDVLSIHITNMRSPFGK